VVYVNIPKKEHFEHKKGGTIKESYIGTILAFSYSSNYTSSNVLRISSLLKKAFKEVYCTISAFHGTAVSKKFDGTGK